MSFLTRLEARTAKVGSCLCLGLDPHPEQLPDGFSRDVAGIEAFSRMMLEAATPYAAAVKANLAFFEAYGSAGMAALERLRAHLPADLPFIADAKRGDIGSTAERQAVALYDALGAEAITANPYLGRDAIEPLLDRRGIFVYLVCRTSNQSAAELQSLMVDGEPLYLRVARLAVEWAAGRPKIGLVVGATAPVEMSLTRHAAPALPFLVPGAGAQRGDMQAVMEHGPAADPPSGLLRGGSLLVNASRAIGDVARRAGGLDPAQAIAEAAASWSGKLRC